MSEQIQARAKLSERVEGGNMEQNNPVYSSHLGPQTHPVYQDKAKLKNKQCYLVLYFKGTLEEDCFLSNSVQEKKIVHCILL